MVVGSGTVQGFDPTEALAASSGLLSPDRFLGLPRRKRPVHTSTRSRHAPPHPGDAIHRHGAKRALHHLHLPDPGGQGGMSFACLRRRLSHKQTSRLAPVTHRNGNNRLPRHGTFSDQPLRHAWTRLPRVPAASRKWRWQPGLNWCRPRRLTPHQVDYTALVQSNCLRQEVITVHRPHTRME